MSDLEEFDVVVVGAGPAGMSAALYATRFGLKTIIYEKGLVGGQIATTDAIENYPGFKEVGGMELVNKMKEQVEHQGAKISYKEVINFKEFQGKVKVNLNDSEVIAKTLIFTGGSFPRKLGVLGEKEFENKGIHYCALCDGPFYKGREVAVIGGGDSALKEAIPLARMTKKVYIIHRRDEFRSKDAWARKIKEILNIEVILNTEVKEFKGDKFLEKLVLYNNKTKKTSELAVSGSFTYIGHIPGTKNFDFKKNENGYIIVDENKETSIRNVFAAGDCVAGSLAQIATSVGEGVTAATKAFARIEGEI